MFYPGRVRILSSIIFMPKGRLRKRAARAALLRSLHFSIRYLKVNI